MVDLGRLTGATGRGAGGAAVAFGCVVGEEAGAAAADASGAALSTAGTSAKAASTGTAEAGAAVATTLATLAGKGCERQVTTTAAAIPRAVNVSRPSATQRPAEDRADRGDTSCGNTTEAPGDTGAVNDSRCCA